MSPMLDLHLHRFCCCHHRRCRWIAHVEVWHYYNLASCRFQFTTRSGCCRLRQTTRVIEQHASCCSVCDSPRTDWTVTAPVSVTMTAESSPSVLPAVTLPYLAVVDVEPGPYKCAPPAQPWYDRAVDVQRLFWVQVFLPEHAQPYSQLSSHHPIYTFRKSLALVAVSGVGSQLYFVCSHFLLGIFQQCTVLPGQVAKLSFLYHTRVIHTINALEMYASTPFWRANIMTGNSDDVSTPAGTVAARLPFSTNSPS